jgi:hypothetical protein
MQIVIGQILRGEALCRLSRTQRGEEIPWQ